MSLEASGGNQTCFVIIIAFIQWPAGAWALQTLFLIPTAINYNIYLLLSLRVENSALLFAALSPGPWAVTGACQALDKYLRSEWTAPARMYPFISGEDMVSRRSKVTWRVSGRVVIWTQDCTGPSLGLFRLFSGVCRVAVSIEGGTKCFKDWTLCSGINRYLKKPTNLVLLQNKFDKPEATKVNLF